MLLQVEGLETHFHVDGEVVRAVDGVSFHVGRGETLAVVGESGSGKSVSTHSILGLLPVPPARVAGGRALFDGVDLLRLSQRELRGIRGDRIAMIFQDPMTSLNPYLRVERQLTEVLQLHRGVSRRAARERSVEMLKWVGIPDPERRIDAWPHELSGGMRQRVMIAMALLCEPELLIADEPTTALDVTIQAQILELLARLQGQFGTAIVFITHDLGVVAGIAHRVMVMYAGKVMETGPTEALFGDAAHPYTRALLRAVPRLGAGARERLLTIDGQPPDPARKPAGCPFHPRCTFAQAVCKERFPEPVELGGGHVSWCWEVEAVRAGEGG
ncbi:MAG: ABC transporter ATP-binding protein [Myxococcales bacterium]